MQSALVRWIGCAWLILAHCLGSAAGADEVDPADAHAVRAVIEAQLDAIAADDAERAYSYATEAIRRQFADAATFMAMVRQGYPMVVRPATTAFFQPEAVEDQVLQPVRLRDPAGRSWLATYQLMRQEGLGWRINGCAVVPDLGKPGT
jgi:hypothetical protein